MVYKGGQGGKPIAIVEARAIMIYLSEKSGWKLMPQDLRRRYDVTQGLMFQMASVGPMRGQAHHFRRYAPEKLQYAIDRYTNEAQRIYVVIDKRLGEANNLPGGASIADIGAHPWMLTHTMQGQVH